MKDRTTDFVGNLRFTDLMAPLAPAPAPHLLLHCKRTRVLCQSLFSYNYFTYILPAPTTRGKYIEVQMASNGYNSCTGLRVTEPDGSFMVHALTFPSLPDSTSMTRTKVHRCLGAMSSCRSATSPIFGGRLLRGVARCADRSSRRYSFFQRTQKLFMSFCRYCHRRESASLEDATGCGGSVSGRVVNRRPMSK